MNTVFSELSSNWPPESRKRKKRSRWGGDDSEKAFIPGMPTAVPMGMTKEQEEQYLGRPY